MILVSQHLQQHHTVNDLLLIGVMARILADKSADVINLKISKVGGLTRARAIRDLAVASGIPMNIEDTW